MHKAVCSVSSSPIVRHGGRDSERDHQEEHARHVGCVQHASSCSSRELCQCTVFPGIFAGHDQGVCCGCHRWLAEFAQPAPPFVLSPAQGVVAVGAQSIFLFRSFFVDRPRVQVCAVHRVEKYNLLSQAIISSADVKLVQSRLQHIVKHQVAVGREGWSRILSPVSPPQPPSP